MALCRTKLSVVSSVWENYRWHFSIQNLLLDVPPLGTDEGTGRWLGLVVLNKNSQSETGQ